jgi:hypothetical protein
MSVVDTRMVGRAVVCVGLAENGNLGANYVKGITINF